MKKRTVFMSAFAALALFTPAALFANGGAQSSASKQVTLTAPGTLPVTRDSGAALDVFMVQYADQSGDLLTNTALNEFQKAVNVKLNLTIAEEGSARERLNLLLNSGQYPEVIVFNSVSATDLIRYGTTEKIFIPLNTLIDEQGTNIKAYFAKYPWVKESITSPDGNIYGIPAVNSGAKQANHGMIGYKLWYNTAWLQKLGLSKPTTTEEFRTMLRAFKTRDPNGNGKADEIPLTGAYGTWAADPYLFLLNAFGYFDESLRMLRNDTFTPTANQDYIRDGLAYIKSLFDEGLLDPASLTQTLQQMTAVGNNPGDNIMGAATCGHLGMAIDIANVERAKVYTTLEPLRGPNGYRGIPANSDEVRPTSGMFMITDKCKNPALALRFADAYCTADWAIRGQVGMKGKQWTDADPGSFGPDGKTPAKIKYLTVVNATTATSNDMLGWAFRLLEEDWKSQIQLVGDITNPVNYEGRLLQETVKLLPYAADVQTIPPLAYSETASARRSQINTALSDYVKNSFAEFITGKRNLTSGWDAYKQELERLGYSEYVKIDQDAYNAYRRK
ncbi:MAG: extracellular solute-binding protein [Treponema sp.]|jgi:putative aldouronate transport system substrate-binding protein|nr:extracellular solute-binding protein [Treponema sp.]